MLKPFPLKAFRQTAFQAMLCGGLLALALTILLREDTDLDWVQALQASATDSGSSFTMATGQIDESVDGVYFLDHTLGTLQCWVLNKNTGTYAARFGYLNVLKDVGASGDKNPALLMTTGNYLSGGGVGINGRPANCLVYILNESTGQFAIYSVPWNPMLHGKRGPAYLGRMALVNTGMARDPELFRDR